MILQMPFTNDAAQTVSVALTSGTYTFMVRWNERASKWMMSIGSEDGSTVIVANIPILLGQALLQPFDLSIGEMIAYAEDGVQVDAAFEDLGVRINVYYISPDLLPDVGD